MIIHPLTIKLENGELCVSARIELEKPPFDFPEILWFRFPEAQAHLVSECPDGFAIALLSTALHRREDIHVRGTLSPALTYGLNEFQYVQNLRKPQRYKPIQIHADGYKRRESIGSKAASTFSGGIDSFYTGSGRISRKMSQSKIMSCHMRFSFKGSILDCMNNVCLTNVATLIKR